MQKGHKKTNCSNDWKCKTCGENGHISKNCISEFDKNSQIASEDSTEESDEGSENELEKDEEIVTSQSTENLSHTDDTPQNKETSNITELTKDTSKVDVPTQNISKSESEAPIEQSPEQNQKKKEKEKSIQIPGNNSRSAGQISWNNPTAKNSKTICNNTNRHFA